MNKKQILSTILSVCLTMFAVMAIVSATTTVGNNVSVGGTLTVTGTTTLNDGIVIGNAVTDKVAVIGQLDTGLVWSATTTTYGLDFDTASTTLTADIRLQEGATIDNSGADTLTITEGTVVISNKLSVTATSTLASSTVSGVLAVGTTTPAANSIFIVASSTKTALHEILTVNRNGKVGISTTSPTAILEVANSSASSTVRVGSYGQIGCLALWSTTTGSYGYVVLSGTGGLTVATTAAEACGL